MPFEFGTEVYRKAFPDHRESPNRPTIRGYISYGLRFPAACAKHINDSSCANVYIIVSRTLANLTPCLEDLKAALGSKVVGVRIGMTSHTLWSECVEVTNECRELGVDLIVTLGGGSLTDAAKLIALALANDVKESEDLKKLPKALGANTTETKAPTVPIICIPTTLSGGEWTNHSGATEDATRRKYQFAPPLRGPSIVILDPELTTTTPDKIWLSTGVRAVDHCVETLCSLINNKKGDADATQGLKALISGLLKCKTDRNDLEARLSCQIGVMFALSGPCRQSKPGLGASHAIGHMMGPLGVGHGETSCIVLPAVCKFNASKGVNVERQEKILEMLWELPEIQDLGLDKAKTDLGDILDAFFRALGMPRTLKDVGIEGDTIEELAENTLHDEFAGTNPHPLKTKEDVMEILELVKG
ncbi:putative Fe-containing alcohol dehydrogenase [Calocera cornea HHB12733]|uniref:Putative Fe-containing alcohol dehydrogenase n=1 Tax=Calocera cornea HHB12733 TaxID=1353952 RepID=A0A165CDI6_9BASI|nr:putative Fe-containing alcohol dehydrogenase [Calocera cornea HHB12733]